MNEMPNMPNILGFKHHDNFISEFLFDPDELNLGFLIDYFDAFSVDSIHHQNSNCQFGP